MNCIKNKKISKYTATVILKYTTNKTIMKCLMGS